MRELHVSYGPGSGVSRMRWIQIAAFGVSVDVIWGAKMLLSRCVLIRIWPWNHEVVVSRHLGIEVFLSAPFEPGTERRLRLRRRARRLAQKIA